MTALLSARLPHLLDCVCRTENSPAGLTKVADLREDPESDAAERPSTRRCSTDLLVASMPADALITGEPREL